MLPRCAAQFCSLSKESQITNAPLHTLSYTLQASITHELWACSQHHQPAVAADAEPKQVQRKPLIEPASGQITNAEPELKS